MSILIQQRKILVSNAWKWKCGLEEDDYRYLSEYNNPRTYKSIKDTQWNKDFANIVFNGQECEFTNLMRGKLIFGHYRYNSGKQYSLVNPIWDYINSIFIRWQKFKETNNLEFLVDVANYCMLSFTNNIGDFPIQRDFKIIKVEIVIDLIKTCDYFIENIKEGVLDSLYDLTKCVQYLYYKYKDNPNYHYTVEDDTIHTKLINK